MLRIEGVSPLAVHRQASPAISSVQGQIAHFGFQHAAFQAGLHDAVIELEARQQHLADDKRDVSVHGLQAAERKRRIRIGGFGFRRFDRIALRTGREIGMEIETVDRDLALDLHDLRLRIE